MRLGVLALLAALLPVIPASAAGQERPRVQSALLLGPSPYDLSGTGTGLAFNAGITLPLAGRVLLAEPSVGIFTYRSQFGKRTHWLFPELSIQAQAGLGVVHPYIGGGLGAGTAGLSGPAHWVVTLHGLAGLRVHLGGPWGVRGEMRVRSVDPFHGNTVDVGLGITRTSF